MILIIKSLFVFNSLQYSNDSKSNYLFQFSLSDSATESYHNLGLRCNSKQLFPNGSVIYQSSITTQLSVLVKGDVAGVVEVVVSVVKVDASVVDVVVEIVSVMTLLQCL